MKIRKLPRHTRNSPGAARRANREIPLPKMITLDCIECVTSLGALFHRSWLRFTKKELITIIFFTLIFFVSQKILGASHFVSTNGTSVSPYSSWETAAVNIQDAIDVCSCGGIVLVSNGLYNSGGGVAAGSSNRIMITKPITVRAVAGAENTIIAGSDSVVQNCLVVDNSSGNGGGVYCMETLGHDMWATVRNSIIYDNIAPEGSNFHNDVSTTVYSYSCTIPEPYGPENITDIPEFIDAAAGNFRLPAWSPCVNAGTNAFAPIPYDLDGNPRIYDGTVDIGCYEFVPEGGSVLIFGIFILFFWEIKLKSACDN